MPFPCSIDSAGRRRRRLSGLFGCTHAPVCTSRRCPSLPLRLKVVRRRGSYPCVFAFGSTRDTAVVFDCLVCTIFFTSLKKKNGKTEISRGRSFFFLILWVAFVHAMRFAPNLVWSGSGVTYPCYVLSSFNAAMIALSRSSRACSAAPSIMASYLLHPQGHTQPSSRPVAHRGQLLLRVQPLPVPAIKPRPPPRISPK